MKASGQNEEAERKRRKAREQRQTAVTAAGAKDRGSKSIIFLVDTRHEPPISGLYTPVETRYM